MEELIFFAVIIFFSIIESIARSRKQKRRQAEESGDLPELPEPERSGRTPDRPPPRREVPTYDEQPSYDDRAQGDTGTRPQPTASGPPSSDVLLPGDLLAELERLAGKKQEERRARTLELPKESPPIPTRAPVPAPPRRAPLPSKAPKKAPVEHVIHLSHAGYGTDPSSRPRSAHDTLDPLAEKLGADAEAVRRKLRSRSASELRQAIILHEVLGPPVGLRE